jgi:hypothetical protein
MPRYGIFGPRLIFRAPTLSRTDDIAKLGERLALSDLLVEERQQLAARVEHGRVVLAHKGEQCLGPLFLGRRSDRLKRNDLRPRTHNLTVP